MKRSFKKIGHILLYLLYVSCFVVGGVCFFIIIFFYFIVWFEYHIIFR